MVGKTDVKMVVEMVGKLDTKMVVLMAALMAG